METPLTIRRVGDSLAVILPQSMVDVLNVKEGDELRAVAAGDGIMLVPSDPYMAEVLRHAEDTMRLYDEDMRELAK